MELSRVNIYFSWLDVTNTHWMQPNLQAYANYLLNERDLDVNSVKSYLGTIRSRYNAWIDSPQTRKDLFDMTPEDWSMADKKAYVDEVLERVRLEISPRRVVLKTITVQDRADEEHIRLTEFQANMLLRAPGVDSLKGLRDTAIIGMMLCTGLRVSEVCALRVDDLRQYYGGKLSVRVREGKGGKQRLVPYGELEWVLAIVNRWIETAGFFTGPVFRGFFKGYRKLRMGPITERAVQAMLEQYPVMIDGELRTVNPHDLRRTYARRMYEANVDILRISQNLGHGSIETTKRYIGALSALTRRVVLKTIHYLSRRLTDMKHFTLTALLVLVIVYLWRRLQDETARADEHEAKAHQTAQDTARITRQYGTYRAPLSAIEYAVICAENDLIPIDWTEQGDNR